MSENNGLTHEEQAMLDADRSNTEPVVTETPPEEAVKEETNGLQEKQETKEEVKESKPPEGFVPHGALHEERAKRKELQKQFQELNEKFARQDERLKMLSEGRKDPEPTFDDDPLGYSKREIERVRESVDGLNKQYPNQLNELKGELEAMRLQRAIEKQEAVFEKNNPDYRDALNYYIKTRSEALEDAGFEKEDANLNIQQELQSVIARSMQSGKNPAEAVYKMSSKIGFKSQAKTESNIETLKKTETASKSLSSSSGKTSAPLSAESIAEMSDEDFAKLSHGDFKKVFGG